MAETSSPSRLTLYFTRPSVTLTSRVLLYNFNIPEADCRTLNRWLLVSRSSPSGSRTKSSALHIRQVEGREWWLWGTAVVITLVLTFGILSLALPSFEQSTGKTDSLNLKEWFRGLAALVFLFDLYIIYQQRQLHKIRRKLAEREQLFQLITENAADMIAVIDGNGQRLYNSPAYQKVLGYGPEELAGTSSMDQIHPDDRARVLEASAKARSTGRGERLEYRIRHKDGSWRFLESTCSVIQSAEGESDGLVIVSCRIHHGIPASRSEAGYHAFVYVQHMPVDEA